MVHKFPVQFAVLSFHALRYAHGENTVAMAHIEIGREKGGERGWQLLRKYALRVRIKGTAGRAYSLVYVNLIVLFISRK